jgi:hypothetical protein
VQLDDILIFLFIAGSIITSIIRTMNEQNKKRPPQGQQSQQRGQNEQHGQGEPPAQTGLPQQTGDLQKRLEEARRRVQRAMENQRGGEGEIGRPPSAPPPLISGGLEGTSLEGQTRARGTLTGQTRERGSLEGQVGERGSLEGQAPRRGTLESSGGLLRQPSEPKRPQYTTSETQRDVFRPVQTPNRNSSDFQQEVRTVQPFMVETSHQGQTQLSEAVFQARKRPRTPTNAPKHAKIGGSELLSPEMLSEKELLRGFLWKQILSEPRSKTQLRTYSLQRARPTLKE